MRNRMLKNGGIAGRADEPILLDQASKCAGVQLPPVNVLKPDTLPQGPQFSLIHSASLFPASVLQES